MALLSNQAAAAENAGDTRKPMQLDGSGSLRVNDASGAQPIQNPAQAQNLPPIMQIRFPNGIPGLFPI